MIVSVNFKKLCVERYKDKSEKLNINNNIKISGLEEAKIKLKPSDSAVKINFEFTSNYEPGVAKITIIGEAMEVSQKKEISKLMKEWSKNKKIPEEVLTRVMNLLLSKCNIEAIILSKEANLPPPLPMPRVGKRLEKNNTTDSYIG